MPETAKPAPPPLKPRKRWAFRPRFSLRTLLLGVLLIGSAATLWHHWAPWRKYSVPGGDACFFSEDSRFLVRTESELTPDRKAMVYHASLYDVNERRDVARAQHRVITIGSDGNKPRVLSPDAQKILVVDFSNGSPTEVLSVVTWNGEARVLCEESSIPYASFSPDGSLVLAIVGKHAGAGIVLDYRCRIWRAADGIEVATVPLSDQTESAEISYDNKWLLAAGHIIDIASKQEIADVAAHSHFLKDSLDVGYFVPEKCLGIWRASTRSKEILTPPIALSDVIVMLPWFTSDRILLRSESDLEAWDLKAARRVADIPYDGAERRHCFSDDGQRLCLFDESLDALRMISLKNGDELCQIKFSADRVDLQFSPDGQYLSTVSHESNTQGGFYANSDLTLWKRMRPEHWWGVAWLPEFWLTVLCGGVLGWSLWRDAKASRRA